MKKSILFAAAAILVASVTFTACNKYEEGPGFSLRSKKSRLAGEWELEKAIENGVDVTAAQNASGTVNVEFEKGGAVTYSVGAFAIVGTWEFSDKKEDIYLTFDGDVDTTHISKLTNKELWFKDTDGSDVTEMHFKAK